MKAADYTMFTKSQPWGYHPDEVEKQIKLYETTIQKLNEKLMDVKNKNSSLVERCEKLEDELRAMHIEMSSLELPDTDELAERVILQEFRNYPNDSGVDIPAPATVQSTPESQTSVSLQNTPLQQNGMNEAFQMFESDDDDDNEEPIPIQTQQSKSSRFQKLKVGMSQQTNSNMSKVGQVKLRPNKIDNGGESVELKNIGKLSDQEGGFTIVT